MRSRILGGNTFVSYGGVSNSVDIAQQNDVARDLAAG